MYFLGPFKTVLEEGNVICSLLCAAESLAGAWHMNECCRCRTLATASFLLTGMRSEDPLEFRQEAYSNVCICLQVQHLHASLSGTAEGLAQAALSELRMAYDSVFKYTGKA